MRSTRSLVALTPFVFLFVLGQSVGCGGTDNDFSKKPAAVDPDNGPVDTNQTKAIRIANYNTKNLFNDVVDGETQAIKESEALDLPSTDAYQAKLANVADVLAGLDADIVVLQEVENEAVLSDLVKQPALVGAGKTYTNLALFPGNDPRGIDVGVISRFPLTETVSHKEAKIGFENQGYSRDCLEVHVDFNSRELILLGIHFRSQVDQGASDGDAKRLAEAKYTRALADKLALTSPRAGILVLGDFNDFPGQPTMNAIASPPPPFTSAVSLLPANEAYTVTFAASGKKIYDDQWANPIMAGFRDAGSVTLVHDRTDVSDHSPVAVTYVVK